MALVGSLLAACAPVASPKAELGPGPDRPVPTSEPRAELGLRLDLEPLRDCEERFDLALYANRAVELITWDEQRDRCEGRLAVIRYLRRLTDDKALLEAARALALRVERAPTAPVAPPASSPHRGAPSPTP